MSKQGQNGVAANKAAVPEISEATVRDLRGTEGPSAAQTYELADDAGDAAADSAPQDLAAQNADLQDQLLRLAADMDNLRKRSRREQEEMQRFVGGRVLADLLPVVDNLGRALAHADAAAGPVIEGVRMVAKQLDDVLATHGVVGFDSVGKPFDPTRHEAVSEAPGGGVAAGTVLHELEHGYMLHSRLLRAAKVVVAAAPA